MDDIRETNDLPETEAPDDAGATEPCESSPDGAATADAAPCEDEAGPEARARELEDRYLRLAAEFDNYKKRTAREWQERARQANADLLHELLDVVDSFDRALAVESNDPAYADGVRLIYDQLQAMLLRQGLEPIEVGGAVFDPTRHDALLHVASEDCEEGYVCQEIRRGYLLHGRVLRPAQVAVSSGAAGKNDGTKDDEHPATNENS